MSPLTMFSFASPETIPNKVYWALFGIAIFAWAIASSILWFHWRTYGSNTKRIVRIRRVYLVGSLIILSIAIGFIFLL